MNRLTLHPAAAATLALLALALYVLQDFLMPMLWAAILAIATWPLYERLARALGATRAAAALTLLIAVVAIAPVVGLSNAAIHELGRAAEWMKEISHEGLPFPRFLEGLPGTRPLRAWWEANLGRPTGLGEWAESLLSKKLYELSHALQVSGVWLLHSLVNLLFSLIALFFFFRDGVAATSQLARFCHRRLGPRWLSALEQIPLAVRATVDGVVLVGVLIGVLVGIGYLLVGVGSPLLLGTLTAFAAMIPLAAPVVYGAVALYLLFAGKMWQALVLFAWSHAVFFVFDHFVRPALIGGAVRVPFLLVLFGILGGLETMGPIGLFVGPVAMVLLMTWWKTELGTGEAPAQ